MSCNDLEKRGLTFIIFFILVFTGETAAQQRTDVPAIIDGSSGLKELSALPKHIKESSGLETVTGKHFWTHNDGGVPVLYCLDTTGTVLRTLQLNHPNAGWEDLTFDKRGNLYVGSFGNNNNDKKSLKIYKIPQPDSIREKVYSAQIIHYKYADQHAFPPPPAKKHFDVDAFVAVGDSLYLFSKNRSTPFTGYTMVYSLPQQPGEYSAVTVDSIFLGKGPMMDYWVTSADLSPDGKTLALLSHACIWIVKDFQGTRFSTGRIFRINLNHMSHKAGLCFSGNERLFITDELEFGFLGGKMYSFDLEKILQNQ
jgi:WD40 repeat protein